MSERAPPHRVAHSLDASESTGSRAERATPATEDEEVHVRIRMRTNVRSLVSSACVRMCDMPAARDACRTAGRTQNLTVLVLKI